MPHLRYGAPARYTYVRWPPRRSGGKSPRDDTAATSSPGNGPRTAAAKTVGSNEMDTSVFGPSVTRPRSASTAAAPRPTVAHTDDRPPATVARYAAMSAAVAAS